MSTTRYAYFKKLDYFSTECIYSPDAYRGHARAFLKDLEAARPSAIIDIIHSGEAFEVREEVKATQRAQRNTLYLCLPSRTISSFHFSKQRHVSVAATCQVTTYVKHAPSSKGWSEAWPVLG
jgi:tRNA(Ile)-lysidine synthase TilS/MesJ